MSILPFSSAYTGSLSDWKDIEAHLEQDLENCLTVLGWAIVSGNPTEGWAIEGSYLSFGDVGRSLPHPP
jgi:hypothetical protein